MLGPLIRSIEEAFVHFSIRRALYILFLAGITTLILAIADSRTEYTLNLRLRQRVALLERLQRLHTVGADTSHALGTLYSGIIEDLKQHNTAAHLKATHLLDRLILMFAAAAVPLIFMFVGLVQMLQKKPGASQVFLGSLVIASVLVPAAIAIPLWGSIRTMTITYILAQSLVMGLVIAYGRRSRKSN